MKQLILVFPLLLLLSTIDSAWAEEPSQEAQDGVSSSEEQGQPKDLLDLPPEQFFNRDLSVYSPAKKLQKLRNIPSAIYVLTAEDIRRSAATNLLDVFRLVPGIEVAQVSAHEWAITARGFNQVFGNKILLLVDGAPVETPIFNGILWENIDIPLDLIERVEFLRGPGAAIWGTRAMNGLINVITKSAFTYPYNRVSIGGGSEHNASVYARAGTVLSEKAALQSYVKLDKYDGSENTAGESLDDAWHIFTGNIRGDFHPTESDRIRVTSNISFRQAHFQLNIPSLAPPFSVEKHDERLNNRLSLGTLWEHDLGNDSDLSVEWTNQYEKRDDFLLDLSAFYTELELRHRFHPIQRNDLTYGVNFRFYTDDTAGSDTLHFDPQNRSLEFYRGFINDEITIISDLLTLTVGSRFEQNEEVGFNALPTARLLWSPTKRLSLWTAVSYSTGSPARVYDDIRLRFSAFQEPETGLPALVQITGNRDLAPENLTAYEIGTWAEPLERLYTSVTGFYFHYNDLVKPTLGDPIPILNDPTTGPYLLLPFGYTNGFKADSIGAEMALDWKVTDWFSSSAVYAYLHSEASPDSAIARQIVENGPNHSFSLQGHFTIDPAIEFDTILRFVDRLPQPPSAVPSYLEGDVRVGWHARQNLELEIIGRNLLHDRHREFVPVVFDTPLSTTERSVFLRTTYTF